MYSLDIEELYVTFKQNISFSKKKNVYKLGPYCYKQMNFLYNTTNLWTNVQFAMYTSLQNRGSSGIYLM